MEIKCKLIKKDFTTEEGQVREYYVIEFILADGQVLDIPIKGDKAKLLIMSEALERKEK